jgi:glyoxylase I family protein
LTSTVRPAPVQTSARSPKTAFRTDDFDGALATLTVNGFREDAAEDDPMRVMVRRNGPAGYPQLFLLDPDRNIIEINGAP